MHCVVREICSIDQLYLQLERNILSEPSMETIYGIVDNFKSLPFP